MNVSIRASEKYAPLQLNGNGLQGVYLAEISQELAEKILKMIPESKSKLVFKPLPSDDPRQRQPNIELAAEKLDWRPTVPLAVGLQKTIDYFRSII